MIPTLLSKSHAEEFWRCPRAEYWGYGYEGGLQPVGVSFDYEFGGILHTGLADLARGKGSEEVYSTVYTQILEIKLEWSHQEAEQWARIGEGLLRGFMRRIWPQLLEDYEVLYVEPACVLPLDSALWFVARPDLLLRHKVTGECWYVEYKTTGWVDTKWLNSWQKAVQVHSGINAAEHTLGLDIAGCIVQGLWKGRKDYYRKFPDGRPQQSSPFAWGWRNRGTPGVTATQYSSTYMKGKGWEQFPTSEYPEGLAGWVASEYLTTEVLDAQFVRTPPILKREDIIERFLAQQVKRYIITHDDQVFVDAEWLDAVFPQNFRACDPLVGGKCPFNDICWSSWVAEDPLGSGLYQKRDTSHLKEFIELIEVKA